VFIIINEWTDEDQDYEVIYGDRYWTSEADAQVRLAEIAHQFSERLEDGATSFDLGDGISLERDSYYIRELTRG
jgi:hypothetical protein